MLTKIGIETLMIMIVICAVYFKFRGSSYH